MHEISAQNEAAAQYNNWKFQDKPGTMMYAPGMERTHIFSYDYRENPNLVSGIVTNDPQADDVEKANVDINESPGEVIQIHISPRAKGENRKVKKIIKRIRI